MEMPFPSDIPTETLPAKDGEWESHWKAMIDYLEEQAPCIYIPNYDWGHSCVSPKLSNRIGIVGIVHSDDPDHYEHVSRMGRYWNSIVTVSKFITDKTREFDPTFSQKLVTIPYGVNMPDTLPTRLLDTNTPLKIVYAGRLLQHQKRIFDIPKIAEALLDLQVPFELTLIGKGPDQHRLKNELEHLIKQNVVRFLGALPNEETVNILEHSDVFLLTSDFEGIPVALVEAMGRGCVPVVTDICSGVPELIVDGVNGYRIPIGDSRLFAERLSLLQHDLSLRQEMSLKAYTTVSNGEYRIQDMTQRYVDLFRQVMQEIECGAYSRPYGEINPPLSICLRILERDTRLRQSEKILDIAKELEKYPSLVKFLLKGYRFFAKIYRLIKKVNNHS
jgi:glycosyltransferase involved in cell wall biosynthesis